MSMLSEFKTFAMRGNVIDLAVGVVIGAAFTGIVNSLVKDVIMPPIGFAMGGIDFSNFFVTLKGPAVATLADAQKAGAVTINYGVFINAVINFLVPTFYASVWHEDMTKIALALAGSWMGVGNIIMYRMVNFRI